MPDLTAENRPSDYLHLVDWRRRIASLYARVREQAQTDPLRAWEDWRGTRERLYREHPQSPVASARRPKFRAYHFAYDPLLRFELPLLGGGTANLEPDSSRSGAEAGGMPVPIGWVTVPFPAGTRQLAAYWLEGYADGLFLPFRDATNGQETYGAGRYLLDTAKSADLGAGAIEDTLVLDFNFAYHPSCAFDARWICPLAPGENWLDVPVAAGEKIRRGPPWPP